MCMWVGHMYEGAYGGGAEENIRSGAGVGRVVTHPT